MTISERLAEHVACTGYDALAPNVIAAAKASLIDTLAVAIAARGAPGVREIVKLAVEDGGRPASTLWTNALRLPARAAAFANAFAASALDFDSLHHEGTAHADIVIVPTALAVAEDRGITGKELLAAIAVGDDVLCRLCRSTRLNTGWFYTTLYGPIASAAVTAKLLGADRDGIAAAMGLGSMSSSGTQQPAIERSMGKRMQAALAASAGVTAGYIARAGVDGPRQIVEGPFGLYAMHEPGDAAAITRDLGKVFENTRIAYKAYPSCQCNHAAIEGMLSLVRTHELSASDVLRVDLTVSPYMQRLVGNDFEPSGNTQVAAQFSIQYSVAAALLYRCFGVDQILDDAVVNTQICALVERVHTTIDPANQNKYAPIRLSVTKRSGEVIEHVVTSFSGAEDRPLTQDDLKKKLTMCLDAAGIRQGAKRAEQMFKAIECMEECGNMTGFVSSMLHAVLN